MRIAAGHTLFPELTYVNATHSRVERRIIETIEALAGRNRLAALYDIWRSEIAPAGSDVFSQMLAMVGMDLRIDGQWPPCDIPATPLMMIANHPFGIADGIAILALAERLRRPFKVMIHADLLRIPEMRRYGLPVDFSETREALANNLAIKQEALARLRDGETIVVFPAGGVATAARGYGRAEDLPWKTFPARLARDAGASVIPLYFAGQNSIAFHMASRVSPTLRTSMLIPEFARRMGRPVEVAVGRVLHAETIGDLGDRKAILDAMRQAVFVLAKPPVNAVPGR